MPGSPDPARARPQRPGLRADQGVLVAYRGAVTELVAALRQDGPPGRAAAEAAVGAGVQRPELASVLARTPGGVDRARRSLLEEVRAYEPSARSSAGDLTALVRIFLLSQIDASWWGDAPCYQRDQDVCGAADLVDLEALRKGRCLAFQYRRQPETTMDRLGEALRRRLTGRRSPATAGVKFTRTRPEVVALLGQLTAAFADAAPRGTPPLWVTSLTRSVEHQHRLRSLGYSAMLPSSHCTGYATDIEMCWFARFGADTALAEVLLEFQARGQVNVIDEGQAWHVCVSPAAAPPLRRAFELEQGR